MVNLKTLLLLLSMASVLAMEDNEPAPKAIVEKRNGIIQTIVPGETEEYLDTKTMVSEIKSTFMGKTNYLRKNREDEDSTYLYHVGTNPSKAFDIVKKRFLAENQ